MRTAIRKARTQSIKAQLLSCLVLSLLLLSACQPAALTPIASPTQPSATLPPTATPTATQTLTPTASATPTLTRTATPTHTPRPTNTPRPTYTPSLTPTNVPLVVSGWQDIEITQLQLVITDTYPELPDKAANASIAADIQSLLAEIGIEVVTEVPAGETIPAVLTIEATGYVVSGSYLYIGCYNGAKYEGSLELQVAGRQPVMLALARGYLPDSILMKDCNAEPADNAAFKIALGKLVVQGLEEIWGLPVLLPALQHASPAIALGAAWELKWLRHYGELPIEEQVILALIEALDYPETGRDGAWRRVQVESLGILKAISGEDYEFDQQAWRDWWQREQEAGE